LLEVWSIDLKELSMVLRSWAIELGLQGTQVNSKHFLKKLKAFFGLHILLLALLFLIE